MADIVKDPLSFSTYRGIKQYELLKSDLKMVFSCEPKFEQLLTFFKRCKTRVSRFP